jgi:hypothetical protein
VIDPQRPGTVAALVVQAHEQPARLLAQRIEPQQPLAVGDRRSDLPLVRQPTRQAVQGVELALTKPLALLQKPLVV